MTLPINYASGSVIQASDMNAITTAVNANTNGRYARSVSTITTSVTLAAAAGTDYVVFVGSGGAPQLPTAVGNTNKYTIKNIDTTSKTITTTSSQTIDGSSSVSLLANTSLDLVSDGTNWRIT